ncbi:phage portal protein [Terrisporobacter muris]|uniref:Phage portal protein n=1 Tax=Terrisporobacter muris TaxID=2963284 RepID=A0A9X2M8C0_9FIRM|nr:phage portal protein [Terrisporobacter muris]MCR1821719.1 phage portal protein [Terrisporobacter muris]
MSKQQVRVRKIMGNSIGQSKQIDDIFNEFYSQGYIIQPEMNIESLSRITENSDILSVCIEAYKNNIVGFGTILDYNFDYKEEKSKNKIADEDWSKYELFLKYCNFDERFTGVLKKFIEDRERIGYGTIECIADETGEISELQHIPSHTVRLCKESDPIEVEEVITDSNGNERKIKRWKKFKKFIQMVGSKQVYFKELGDPRKLNRFTGEYLNECEEININDEANSIIFDNIYCPYTPYGLPRYIGALVKMMGSRSADELNFNYFEGGRHIPLAIVVENGQLTQDSIDSLAGAKGTEAQHKYLILEAEAFDNEFSMEDSKSNVKIHFEKLAEIMQDDALFLEYLKDNRDIVRSSFRLTPIYTGDTQDFNRATAETAKKVTEEQTFEPLREDLADLLNKKLMKELNIKYVELKFKGPKTTDDTEIAKALTPYIAGGVATPNMLLDSLSKLLGKEFEPITDEWGDIPLQVYLSNKNINNKQQVEEQNPISKAFYMQEVINPLKELQKTIEGALNG